VQKRRKDQAYKEKKKGGEVFREKQATNWNQCLYYQYCLGDRSKGTDSSLLFFTLASRDRIQNMEIVFSDRCKKVKRERLECHLYGQLIAILICSTTLFRMRELLLREKHIELSEYKAFRIIQTYFSLFHRAIQQENTQAYAKILLRLLHLLKKNGRKSHRYEKKTVFDILGVVYEYTISTAKVA
jgi:hypothetical protein